MHNNENARPTHPTRLWTAPLLCAGTLALYAISLWAGFQVFAQDQYAGHLAAYATLALISLATTALCETVFNLLGINRDFRGRQYIALMVVAGLLLTATYGPQIYIKFYEYDDWIYMPYQFGKLDWPFLLTPINDHFVPLLKVILYYVSKFSDPTYYGNAVVFYLADMLVLTALARVVQAHTRSFGLLAFAVIAFAIWPSFGGARIWFGGGFWLAVPVAAFLALIPVVREILLETSSSWKNYLVLALLALATVLSSSQILIPFIFIGVYLLPYFEAADAVQRPRLLRRGLAISALLLLPTVLAFFGRNGRLKNAPDFSGLLDGAYLTNLVLFIKAKVGYEKFSTTLLVCLVLFFGGRALYRQYKNGGWRQLSPLLVFLYVLAFCGMTMPKAAFNSMTTPLWIGGALLLGMHALYSRLRAAPPAQAPALTSASAMLLCGLSMLMFYILQVGIGRRWGVSTALADYYAMFPLAGCWLLGAGILAIYFQPADDTVAQHAGPTAASSHGATWFRSGPAAYFALLILAVTFVYSMQKYFPTSQYVGQVMAQKGFVRDLGLAACSEAKAVAPEQRLFVRARQPFTSCKSCGALLLGPESFVSSMSEGGDTHGGYFQFLGKVSAQRLCPQVADRLAFTRAESTIATDGTSEETTRLYKKYFD